MRRAAFQSTVRMTAFGVQPSVKIVAPVDGRVTMVAEQRALAIHNA